MPAGRRPRVRVLVAIPVYNEERHLHGVLAAVRRWADDVLVVNDGSTDRTGALLAGWPDVYTLTHPVNRGYGQSVIDAFAFAADRDYDWVITMDCDEQHEPSQIPDFIAAARQDDADIISGSRYLLERPDDDPPPPDRLRINRRIRRLLAAVLGLHLTDAFCGFKAQRVAALRKLRLTETGYAFPLQFWVQCARAGLRIREIPVARVYRDRNRQFGGALDDPDRRLRHYLEVFVSELCRGARLPQPEACLAEARCP